MTVLDEPAAHIELCLLDETCAEILDLVSALLAATSSLGRRLHPYSAAGFAASVRIMNGYDSDLTERLNTTPREIERALVAQCDVVRERRNLQVEARAQIRVQREVDRRYAVGELPELASATFIACEAGDVPHKSLGGPGDGADLACVAAFGGRKADFRCHL